MEEVSIIGLDVSTICRLCLSSAVTTVDIFAFSNRLMDEVANVIVKCAPVQVTRCDEMPNLICQSCYAQLEKSHQFQKQIIQSDQTLRRYLQQIRLANKQIKAERSIQGSSNDRLFPNTNTNITMKCETVELVEVFDTNVDLKEEVPINYTSAYKINEDMPLKTAIKEPPMDDSFIPTENTAILIDSSSEVDDDIEIVCEKSEIGEQFDTSTGNHFASVTKHSNVPCALSVHKRTHTDEKPYKCDVCNKYFVKAGHFHNHKRTHTDEKLYKLHQCHVCGKCFHKSDQLRRHKLVHTEEKPYKCDVCNKCFKENVSLKIHVRMHTGEKPYQCDVCGKRFIRSETLSRHHFVHTGVRNYRCGVCDKSFYDSDHLKRHERIHTGLKPYQCEICDKRFSMNQHLKTHLKGVHKKTMLYSCTSCDEKFKIKRDLNLHIEDVHNASK